MPKADIPKNDFDYALTESQAEVRFKRWQEIDPFPEISPALLNSADIADYVLATGMIWPFHAAQLKSAAYEMKLGNEFLYWDENGNEIHDVIADATGISLKKNSITYVTLKETFLLPDYIALRFNLTISHVHRGLLLGTGPLVNPGFQGKLMIPIHNLTPNEYHLRPGDPLISVEFTKLSPVRYWARNVENLHRPIRKGKFIPKHKPGFSFKEYLRNALPHGTNKVESSLANAFTEAINEIREYESKSNESIKSIEKHTESEIYKAALSRRIVSGATLFSVGGLAWMTFQIFQSNQEFISQAIDKNSEIHATLMLQKEKLIALEGQLHQIKVSKEYSRKKELHEKVDCIEKEIKRICVDLDTTKTQIKSVK